MQHEAWMALALAEAKKAFVLDEVPIGAVIVNDTTNRTVARAANRTIADNDPTAHAEMLAIREAARRLGNYRLLNTSLYVTVEPCFMCMGAILHARISRVVFGVHDPKWGAAGSVYDFPGDTRLNHHPEIISEIRGAECVRLMRDFFHRKR
ncbi:MAG: nucleoside deaminase [Okeania sp. SIO3C4]|nr:nucleoside deaminase [Okeania sp. SIO3C4]